MKPRDFRPWAEQVFAQSPAVAAVDAVQQPPPEEYITHTHVTFETGARLVIHWVGTSSPNGSGPVGEPDPVVTGPPPAPVKVPDLAASGRLRTAGVEQHLAALLNNGGHDQILDVDGYSAHPKLGSETQPYGIRVRFHDESAAYGLFIHTLSSGQRPGAEFDQRKEI
jgi:hypothetical protein